MTLGRREENVVYMLEGLQSAAKRGMISLFPHFDGKRLLTASHLWDK